MISFCGGRSQAGVREVLPPRKSLRLQNKEAEVLTLPPEPKGVLSYEKVAAYKKNLLIYFSHLNWSHSTAAFNSVSSISFSCRSFFSLFCYSLVILLVLKSWAHKKPPGPLPMDAVNMDEGSKLPSQLFELCSEVGGLF